MRIRLTKIPARCTLLIVVCCWCVVAGADNFLSLASPVFGDALADPARYTAPFPGEESEHLDAVLAEVFPDGPPHDHGEAALGVMRYIAQVYPSGPPSQYNRTGATALQTTPNLCGDKSLGMVALCRRLGIPARVVPMNNFVALNAHIAVEVWYDGGWHYMDPTYGAFYYSEPSFDGSGRIPSMRELATDPELRQHPFFVGADSLWSGEFRPTEPFVALPPDFQPESWQPFTVAETLDRAMAQSFPIERAPDRPRSFPVSFDLRTESRLERGAIDGNPHDLSSPAAGGEEAPRYYATHFLGAGDMEHVFHTLTMRQPAGSRVRVSYFFVQDAPQAHLDLIELKGAVIALVETEPKAWHFEFTAQDELAILLVANRGPALLLDALHATRVDAPGEVGE